MSLDRAWIVAHIPHQGGMCLLDAVDSWNEAGIVCRANSHRLLDNPLRTGDSLGIANGIEYAAQAMAVHGALLASDENVPASGFLTSMRDVQWNCIRLDDIESDLTIRAERISSNGNNVLYSFAVNATGTTVMSGRASVMINAEGK